MCTIRSMKKLLILSAIAISVVGCAQRQLSQEEVTQKVATNEHVQLEIKKLQTELERGEITESYAQERLKQILRNRVRDNSGDPEVILEKIGEQDPMLEKGLAEMIERRQEAEAK